MPFQLNRTYLLLMALSALFFSCENDTTDCKTRLEQEYGKAYCPNCQIGDDRRIFVDFEESDTLIFPYTGTDTLIFEYRDTPGNLDTVVYIGQGKHAKTAARRPGDFSNDCVRSVTVSYFSIEFLPEKPMHKPLFFDLKAGEATSYFTYDFMNARLNADVWGIDVGNFNGYMPVFNYRGREFYHVTKAKVESADGSIKWFYISRESQLVFAIGSDSTYYLKIN